jgi:hypothetical protein
MKELQKLLSQVEQFKLLGYESHYYQWHTKRIIELKNKLK